MVSWSVLEFMIYISHALCFLAVDFLHVYVYEGLIAFFYEPEKSPVVNGSCDSTNRAGGLVHVLTFCDPFCTDLKIEMKGLKYMLHF